MEKWKKIADSATYEVSSEGRVRNAKTGQLLSITNLGGSGYIQVGLRGDIGKNCMVHRLVALAFLCNPDGKRTVNHINGVKTDNRLENLEWATHSENNQHSYDTGLKAYRPLHYKGKFGAEHNRALVVEQLDKAGVVIARYNGISEASRITGIGITSIHHACHHHGINRRTQSFFRFPLGGESLSVLEMHFIAPTCPVGPAIPIVFSPDV